MNSRLPGIFITSAEINFLKAEYFQRWGGGDAHQVYQLALKQSIRFYYYLNQLNTDFDQHENEPGPEAIVDFLNGPELRLSGTQAEKLEKICSQRWLHYGLLQSTQAWADQRRTGYPKLIFPVNNHPEAQLPPQRLLYPDNEVTYNVNYIAVRDRDKPYFPIFWQTR